MPFARPLPALLFVPVLSFAISSALFAQEPSITSLQPQGAKPGEAVNVTVKGANLDGATQLWTSFPARVELAKDVKDNGKNKAQVVFHVTPDAQAGVGVHGVRVVTGRGVSGMKLFVVDDITSVPPKHAKTIETAQVVTLPAAIDGSIANLSRNYFRFKVAAGATLSMEVLAKRIGSALDPMLRLLDGDGREITYADDTPGLHTDAQICHTFKEAGEYVLELRDIAYTGGANHIYRVRIGDFPCVNAPYPMAGKRGSKVDLRFAGAGAGQLPTVPVSVPSDPSVSWVTVGAKRADGGVSGLTTIAVSDATERLEQEPNNELDKATPATLGENLNGRLDNAGDVDHFRFAAKKGQRFNFTAVTRDQGSPADLYLRLLSAEGKQLAAVDDTGTEDAVIKYTFPADGDYIIAAEDLHGRGGSAFVYRVKAEEQSPGFRLSAKADHASVPAGGTLTVSVLVTRTGYNGVIELTAAGLPTGITMPRTLIGPGQKGTVVTFTGAANTKPGSFANVKLVGVGKLKDKTYRSTASIETALQASLNAATFSPPQLSDDFAVAAAPAAQYSLRVEPPRVTFGRDLTAKVKVIATRSKDFNEAITLAVANLDDGSKKPPSSLPGGVTAAVKPIPAGKNEVEIVLTANSKAPLSEFTSVFTGTLKKGKASHAAVTPAFGVTLTTTLGITLDVGDGKLNPGETLKAKVSLTRNPAFAAPVAVTFQNLPKGVTAAKATIPGDKSEAEIVLTAAKDAAPATVKNLIAEGNATIGKVKFNAKSRPRSLTVAKP